MEEFVRAIVSQCLDPTPDVARHFAFAVYRDALTAALMPLVGAETSHYAVDRIVKANFPRLRSRIGRESQQLVVEKADEMERNLAEAKMKSGRSSQTFWEDLRDMKAQEVLGPYYEGYVREVARELDGLIREGV